MYQIAIGDSAAGFTVIEGATIAAPYFKATPHFVFNSNLLVSEYIEIHLKGTPTQISAALTLFNAIAYRATTYDLGIYSFPQQLRFQTLTGEPYYYAQISLISIDTTPAGYLDHYKGSQLVILHYTRPNYFDGPKTALPLTGRSGADVTTGLDLLNHTDSGVGHGSTALIKKAHFATDLPAPLRFEITSATAGPTVLKTFMLGLYHHPTYDADTPFFVYYSDLTGGTDHADAAAIEGNFKRVTWTLSSWSGILSFALTAAALANFQGLPFRPIIRLFTTHAYTDLYFKVALELNGYALTTSEPVHSPPAVGHVNLPPINLPPNFLLREVDPAALSVVIYAWRESGAATTVELDCITLFPLASAATFYGFVYLGNGYMLVDDSSLQRFNLRTAAAAGESMSHQRVGGAFLLPPGHNTRLFFHVTDGSNLMTPTLAVSLKAYYYPRVRLL